MRTFRIGLESIRQNAQNPQAVIDGLYNTIPRMRKAGLFTIPAINDDQR
jgi:hypothetical protein